MTRSSRWLGGASYLQKWLILGVLIGTMAGVGAIVFYEALLACTHYFLGTLAGYHVPPRSARALTGLQHRSPDLGRCRWWSDSAHCSGESSSSAWRRRLGGELVPIPQFLLSITTPGASAFGL